MWKTLSLWIMTGRIFYGEIHGLHNMTSVSRGGTEKNLFRLSLGYMYDNSTLKWGNNNNQRYNMRLNNQFKLSDAVMLTSSIGYNRQDQVSPSMIGKFFPSLPHNRVCLLLLSTDVPMDGERGVH